MEKLIAVGVPAGAVFDTMELQNEPSFEERGFMQTVKHHNGDYKMASWPVRVDGKTVRLKGSPALGQDTAEVLQQLARHRRRRGRGAARRGRALAGGAALTLPSLRDGSLPLPQAGEGGSSPSPPRA